MTQRAVRSVFAILAAMMILSCNDDNSTTPSLPSGCQAQGVFAIGVLKTEFQCPATNAYLDPNQALGPPDAGNEGGGKLEFHGFTSLGVNGSMTLFMGSCIQDLPGDDVRVFQSVSTEGLEVLVSQNTDGPFVSLGTVECKDGPPVFTGSCGFDLAGSGLNNIRVVKIIDREAQFFQGAQCDNAGPSPGADIDAVEVIHPL